MKTRKFLASLFAVLAISALACALMGCGAKDVNVTIDDNGTVTEVSVAQGKTVGDALAAADIKLGEKDVVDPSLDTKIDESTNKITVKRCVTVKVVDGDHVKDIEIVGGSVADALTSAEIVLADGDTVDVDLAAPVQEGMTIVVTRAAASTTQQDDSAADYSQSYDGGSDEPVSDEPASAPSRELVSKTPVPNCNDDNHGYYEILYSDGTMEYEEY